MDELIKIKVTTVPGRPVIQVWSYWPLEKIDKRIAEKFGRQADGGPHEWIGVSGPTGRKEMVRRELLSQGDPQIKLILAEIYSQFGEDPLARMEELGLKGREIMILYNQCGRSAERLIQKLRNM